MFLPPGEIKLVRKKAKNQEQPNCVISRVQARYMFGIMPKVT